MMLMNKTKIAIIQVAGTVYLWLDQEIGRFFSLNNFFFGQNYVSARGSLLFQLRFFPCSSLRVCFFDGGKKITVTEPIWLSGNR